MDITRELPTRNTVYDQFRRHIAASAVAWLLFIFYGSLLPLDFHSVAREEVVRQFLGLGLPDQYVNSFTDWLQNIAIFVPLGFLGLGAAAFDKNKVQVAIGMLVALVVCIGISFGIEFTQIFFPPRNSSLQDVIANSVGAVIGIVSWAAAEKGIFAFYCSVFILRQRCERPPILAHGTLRGLALMGGICLVLAWGGVFTHVWSGRDAAFVKLQGLHYMPFLESQAASIFLAFVSILLVTVVYGVFGFALWIANISGSHLTSSAQRSTVSIAILFAVIVEGLKLFLLTKRPDTSNILLAGLGAGIGYAMAPLAFGMWGNKPAQTDQSDQSEGNHPQDHGQTVMGVRLFWERGVAVACACALLTLVVTYPFARLQLAFALAVYAVFLVRYPMAWLLILPALLPVLDLAPWTGRYFFDEFDGFVLVTLFIGMWRDAGKPLASTRSDLWLVVFGFVVSAFVSAVIGLLPLQPVDANAFASPYSHYSALRFFKAILFAVGGGLLLSHHVAAGRDVKKVFSAGMICGLACAAISVVWERLAYVSLIDFNKDFRVVGLFSTMNTGGAHLDAFLVTAIPFALISALRSRHFFSRIVASTVIAAGTYAVMMTYSRAAVASFGIVFLLIAFWTVRYSTQHADRARNTDRGMGIKLAAIAVLAGAVILPVLFGKYLQERLSTTHSDIGIRSSHWSETVNVMTDDWATKLFGMGLGRYPETYQLLSTETNKPAIFRWESEAGKPFLRLFHGTTLYVEQIVSPEPQIEYVVNLRARTQSGNANLNVLLCDRTYLQGYGCQSTTFKLTGTAGKWQFLQAALKSASVGGNGLRISKISLENAGSDSPIDIDYLEMVSPAGVNLIANGDFHAGSDRWYFSSPFNHLPWHIKNIWFNVYFEQGWFGIAMFCLMLAAVIPQLLQRATKGDSFSAAVFAAVVGYLAVGGFDSMFDAPRLILLFGLLVGLTGIGSIQPVKQGIEKARKKQRAENRTPPQRAAPDSTANGNQFLLSDWSWRRFAFPLLGKVLVAAVTIVIFTRLPGVPYNVRNLPNPFHPIVAPVLLATFIFWTFGFPAAIARWLVAARNRAAWLPIVLIFHGLISWALFMYSVLPEEIHNFIGNPVLDWPGLTEYIARFVPLVSVLTLQLIGGVLFSASRAKGYGTARAWWLVTLMVMAPFQYWVIVTKAATDNLTELIAHNAGFDAFMLLTSYLLLLGCVSSLFSTLGHKLNPTRTVIAIAVLCLSLPIGYFLVVSGTTSTINYQGKEFSALQALLSANRDHYATGLNLWIRFAILHLGAVFVIAFTQHAFRAEIRPLPGTIRSSMRSHQ